MTRMLASVAHRRGMCAENETRNSTFVLADLYAHTAAIRASVHFYD